MKIIASISIMLTLSACAGRLYNFTPTMESDPPELGLEGIALMNELGRAYMRISDGSSPFCGSTKPSFQERGKHSYFRHLETGRDVVGGFNCVGFKPVTNDDAGKAEVIRHMRAGFALADLYCENFFRRVAKHASQRRFARNTTNDVGGAISTILGLAAAGSGVTGGAGAGFALVDSAFRNYDDNFLVSPDLQILQPKVHAEQDQFRESIYATPPANYYDANSAIIRYANFCSYTGMKALLNEAVVKTTPPRSFAESQRAFMVGAATQKEELEAAIAKRKAELRQQQEDDEAKAKGAAESKPQEKSETPD